jgi:hypothetical protein
VIQLSQRFLYVCSILLTIFVFGIANQALPDSKTDSQSKAVFYVH